MLLTIIVCANRDNPFFGAALRSLAEARGRAGDVETILVANGGWDPPAAIADHFDRVLRLEAGGLGMSRNVGVENAKGEWISFFDSDDLLDPDYLRETTAVLRRASDNQIFFNRIRMIDEDGGVLPDRFRLENLPDFLSVRLAHPFTGATIVIRRSDFLAETGYRWKGYAEDYDLTLRLTFSKRRFRLARNDRAFYLYRQHGDTMSGDRREKVLGVRDVQLHHARSGHPSMYLGVAVSSLRLLRS